MELLADRDPEEARKLPDPVTQHMMEAVHHYEGTVNQVMGDGIMALFGAPLAHEDHALRACYAALRMQEAVARYAEGVFHSHGVPLQIRVGLNAYDDAGKVLGLRLQVFRLAGPDDIDRAFGECVRGGVGALDVVSVPVTWVHRKQILDLAMRNRLPAVYAGREYVLEGGLMSYGADEREVPKRLVGYVDKLLRGAKPADLPVEQPTKFDLVINLKTAKALGLTIPPSLLLRADQVIE